MNSSRPCPKGGVKIHETQQHQQPVLTQEDFFNQLKAQNKHTGVRVNETGNQYKEDPFGNVNPFVNPDGDTNWRKNSGEIDLYKLDLDINNYSMEDIYHLFNIRANASLTMEVMKEAKKIVLKMHPDKSKMEAKYFLFFSAAYKMLYGIYEFQNKSHQQHEPSVDNIKDANKELNKMMNLMQPQQPQQAPKTKTNLEQIVLKRQAENSAFTENHNQALNTFFEKNKNMMQNNGKGFNSWFNEQFEQCNVVEESEANGYGEWLTSDAGVSTASVKTAQDMEQYKEQVQTLVAYDGCRDMTTTFGCSLMGSSDNYTGDGFTDLRQAYEQSVIPVTMEDYERMDKDQYRSLDAYQKHRNAIDTKPLDKREALRTLFKQNENSEAQSAALAYHQAKQMKKAKQKQEGFWASLLKITNS